SDRRRVALPPGDGDRRPQARHPHHRGAGELSRAGGRVEDYGNAQGDAADRVPDDCADYQMPVDVNEGGPEAEGPPLRRRKAAVAACVVAVVAVVVYAPTIHDYFLQDDFGVVGLLSQKPWFYFPH